MEPFLWREIESLGVDAVPGEMTDLDAPGSKEIIPLRTCSTKRAANMKKIIAGRQLWNYDNLEPSEKKSFFNFSTETICREKQICLGESFIFKPEVIDDIHIKSELGRYRMRGFPLFKKSRPGMT
ncbi:MAG: hypothetical protein CM15mP66_01960 [Pseudomonadota bacterium]|nr:MAG: hypothetical protein CM15mP66_01960 [Pseudomonadota bacterium]